MNGSRLPLAGLLAVLVGSTVVPASVSAAELIGHRATYLMMAPNLPPDVTVEGDSSIALARSCRGWDYQQHLAITVKAQGQKQSMALMVTGQEDRDGLHADYTIDAGVNDRHAKSEIVVSFPGKGQSGKITFDLNGSRSSKDAPAGLLLMATGTQAMVDRLQAGDRDFTLSAMGPTSPDGVERVHVELLDRSPFDDAKLPDEVQSALPAKFWFVRVTRTDGSLSQTVAQQLYENGVVARSMIDVSGLRLQMSLQRLALLAKPGC